MKKYFYLAYCPLPASWTTA